MILLFVGCGSDAAADTSRAADPLLAWPCGEYAPQVATGLPYPEVSHRSTFAYTDPNRGTGTVSFDAIGETEHAGSPAWVYRQTGEASAGDGDTYAWTLDSFYVCDEEGLKHAAMTAAQSRTEGGVTTSQTMEKVFDGYPLVYPIDVAVGSRWRYATTWTETWSDGTVLSDSTDIEREVTEAVEVTVPAGTWTTLHVVMSEEGLQIDELWSAPEVGTVRGNGIELLSHERFDG